MQDYLGLQRARPPKRPIWAPRQKPRKRAETPVKMGQRRSASVGGRSSQPLAPGVRIVAACSLANLTRRQTPADCRWTPAQECGSFKKCAIINPELGTRDPDPHPRSPSIPGAHGYRVPALTHSVCHATAFSLFRPAITAMCSRAGRMPHSRSGPVARLPRHRGYPLE